MNTAATSVQVYYLQNGAPYYKKKSKNNNNKFL